MPFQKILEKGLPFELKKDDLKFFGNLKRKDSQLICCNSKIVGFMTHNCDRCGNDIVLNLDEDINLSISNGVYKHNENEFEDVIEFFDDNINLEDIFISEIEAYKSDYFYCEKCKNL